MWTLLIVVLTVAANGQVKQERIRFDYPSREDCFQALNDGRFQQPPDGGLVAICEYKPVPA